MKKLIAFFLVATVLSCSTEDRENQNVAPSAVSSGAVLDGKLLSFKDEESFVKEYSDLALLSNEELKSWISSKKLVSLFNTLDESASMEEDVLSNSRVIYSDALKSVLNSESKVKINKQVLWLNERTFYLLSDSDVDKTSEQLLKEKEGLKVYGSLLSISSPVNKMTGRNVIPNENRVKTFVSGEENFNVPGSRIRQVLDLYNETIVLNNQIQSSKMYLKCTLQYRSCSTWRCTWKEASNSRVLDAYSLTGSNSVLWKFSLFKTATSATQTFLIATWNPSNLPAPLDPSNWFTNFNVSGAFKTYVENGGSWHEVQLSWY